MDILCLLFVVGSICAGMSLEAEAKGKGWNALKSNPREIERKAKLKKRFERLGIKVPKID